MVVGVLSLQGNFAEHISSLKKHRIECISVKSVDDLERCTGLIIPGGESTTIGKLLALTGLDKEISNRFKAGSLKVWGTCAGAILCASSVMSDNPVLNLGLGDYSVARNAYGNQLDSFETVINFNGEFDLKCAFIRAPQIEEIGPDWKILSIHENRTIFAIKGNLLVSTCHPELYENVDFYWWLKKWFGS